MSDRHYYLTEVVDREAIYKKAHENADLGDYVIVHYHGYHTVSGDIITCNEVCEWVKATTDVEEATPAQPEQPGISPPNVTDQSSTATSTQTSSTNPKPQLIPDSEPDNSKDLLK